MNADWETKSGDCAVCGAHTAKYPLCDACWSECIDAGDEYCGASSAWIVDKVRARCLEIVEKVCAADSDLIADRIPSECEVASESRLIELVWQAAAKECLKQIRGQNG